MRAGCGPTGRSTAASTTFSFSARATSSASARSFSANRVRRRSRPSTTAPCCGCPVSLFQKLLHEHPEFRERLAERVRQYDYHRLARVPLDFADEILPAEASFSAGHAAEVSSPVGAEAAVELDDGPTPASPRRRRRFPHIFQLDEADCGAACLAMVCRFFGRNVSIAYIREVVRTSTDGTTLAGITRGAEELGLDARSVKASPSRLDELPLPAVVHWRGNHWVVLYRVDGDRVRLSDPARGLRRVTRAEFLENWSGYASVIAYDAAFEEAPESQPSLGWLKPFLRPHRWYLVAAVVLAMLVAALELVLPILTQVVVDHIGHETGLQFLWIVFAAIVGVLIAISAAGIIQGYLLSLVAVRFDISTLDFFTGRLLRLPMSYFAARRTGDIERRLGGARQVRQFLVQGGVTALTAATQLVAALVLMFVYSWVLALIYLASIPVYVGLMRFSAKRLRPMYDNLEEAYGRYSSHQIDAIRGIEVVKALAAEDSLRKLMLVRFQSLADRVFRTQYLVLLYQGSLQLVSFASFGLFLIVGAIEVAHGRLSLGQFVAFNALLALASAPVLALLSLWDEFQYSGILLGRLDDVLAQEPEQGGHEDLRPVTTLAGRVELSERRLPLRGCRIPGDPRRRGPHRRPGSDRRDRRSQRLRQDDADQAARRPDRADRGHDPLRRFRDADARLSHAAPADRLRPPGELPLRRHDRRQHRLRRGAHRSRARRVGREGGKRP